MSPRARHADRDTTDPFGLPPVPDTAVPSPRRPDHSGGWAERRDPAGHTDRPDPGDAYPPDERTWLEPDPTTALGRGRANRSEGRYGRRRAHVPVDPGPDDDWDAPAPEVAGRLPGTTARRHAAAAGDLFAPSGRWGTREHGNASDPWAPPDPRDASTPGNAADPWPTRVPRNAPAPATEVAADPWPIGVPRNAPGPAPATGVAAGPGSGRVPRNASDATDAAGPWGGRVPRNVPDAGDAPERWGPYSPGSAPDRAEARSWAGEHEPAGPVARRPVRDTGPDHPTVGPQLPDDGSRGGGTLRTVLIPTVVGSLVAVALGVWARQHEGTGVAVNLAGFSSGAAVKAWLGSLALLLAIVQGVSGRMLYRGTADPMTAVVHRWSGRAAVLVTVPVAVQCLYAFGWSGATPSALLHSALGCLFYGAFVTKMLLLRRPGVPGWVLAAAGGLLLVVLAGIWLTSALWLFTGNGLTF